MIFGRHDLLDQPRDTQRDGTVLFDMLHRYARATTGVILAMIVATLCEAAGILALLPMLQLAFGEGGQSSAIAEGFLSALRAAGLEPSFGLMLALVLAGLIAAQLLLFACVTYVGYVSSRFGTDLRLALIEASSAASGAFALTRPLGAVVALLSTEANRASGAYIATCNLIVHALSSAILIGAAFMVDWRVTAAAIVVGGLMFVCLRGFLGMARVAGENITSQMRSLLAQVADGLAMIKPLKAMGEEGRLVSIVRGSALALDRAQRAQILAKNGIAAGQDILILLALGAGIYVAHQIAGYALSSLMVLAVLFNRAASMVGQLQKDYQGVLNSRAGLMALLDGIADAREAREIHDGTRAPSFERAIAFEGVSFRYGRDPVLSGVDLLVPSKALTVVTGGSGAGKTTLVDLMVGLQTAQAGRVTVDGVDIRELAIKQWRRRIGYVPQEAVLFHDTVRNNVSLGDPALSDADLRLALERAGALAFVEAMSDGLDSSVGEKGGKLSGGQRQRIAIARALARDPKLLIMDEPTAALDEATERELCRTLAALARHTTVVAVSHRPALTDVADRVVRLEAGRIVDASPPLRAAGGA